MCSNEQMRIKFKDELYFYKCTKCDSTKSIFYNNIFYNKKKKLVEILDLIYFWSLNLVQKKVRTKATQKAKIPQAHGIINFACFLEKS
ncbi:hypothetical protein H311_01377 [Anncaliia algerae PRA109]|nr:hypothetical protein H311_01377 [Anncaliia algerae PRA109]